MSIAKHEEKNSIVSASEADVLTALKNSLYPGARDDSVKMVLSYCRAAKLDPLLKPVHIVPMSVKNAATDKYEWRDVVMPGIGLYRIHADRSGTYAGIDEPEFGPIIEHTFKNKTVKFPEWAKVTVYKAVNGNLCKFTKKEFWLENYATAGKDTTDPNSMWAKRPYGQIAKCAEAQALRAAFPEIGSQPTAEEMEGKVIEYDITEEPVSNKKETIKNIINSENEAPALSFNELQKLISHANSLPELKEVSQKIKDSNHSTEELEKLRDYYSIRKEEIKEAEKV